MDEESKTAVKKEEDIFLFVKRPGDIRKARLFMGEVSGSGLILSLVWNTGVSHVRSTTKNAEFVRR